MPPRDVVRKPRVHDAGRVRFRVRLHQNLAYPYRPAAVSQALQKKKKKLQSLQSFSRIAVECYLLHGLSRAHDRHATVSGAILEPIVDGTGRRHHGTVRVGQLVEAFLDHEPNQPVGVELKVTARCVSKIKQSQTETTRGAVGWW